MKHRYHISYIVIYIGILFFTLFSSTFAQENTSAQQSAPYEIPVGIFVTSLYDLNFANNKYSITAWIWATYDPKRLIDGYAFFDRIEIVNAREWSLSPTEHFIINNPDGTQRSMTKFTAVINQDWDIHYFPFDKQHLHIVIESVELDSTAITFVPDVKNSSVSEDFSLSSWHISPIQLKAIDYEYPTTFGDTSGIKGVYPRIIINIPIERQGFRIFITTFLGFFISYIVISVLVAFDKDMFASRISLILSALFAAVGNKYTTDFLFPPHPGFSLSDLVQVTTFAIVVMGLVNTVIVLKLAKTGHVEFAYKLDLWVAIITTPIYPIIILTGIYFALTAT